jgi:transcriptional regulator with XRE-family HTH domain
MVRKSADIDGLVERLRAARLPAPSARRKIREDAGVSLRVGADALGVEVLTLRRWESGTPPRRLDDQIRYAEFLDRLSEFGR